MIDFVEYLVAELKSKRLTRENALQLIRQYSGRVRGNAAAVLHPLVQTNVSDLDQQCYRTLFDGSEPFLADHEVLMPGRGPVRVLPGVAYLEMARAALADALPDLPGRPCIGLEGVVWIQPLEVMSPRAVSVALAADDTDAGSIAFEVFSQDGDGEEVLHCSGRAHAAEASAPAVLDLPGLRARMGRGPLDAAAVYAAYRRMGMQFGPAHRAVTEVLRGEGEVLARLMLPEREAGSLADYVLHPSLLDGALQAAMGLLGDADGAASVPSLPFALESLQIHGACTAQMYAWLRVAGPAGPRSLTRLDIDLCDDGGRVCATLRGFTSRTLRAEAAASLPHDQADEGVGLVLAQPVWVAAGPAAAGTAPAGEHHVFLAGVPGPVADGLARCMPGVQWHPLPAPGVEAGAFVAAALRCFEAVRTLLQAGGGLVQVVLADPSAQTLAALGPMLRSATLEHPGVRGQVLIVGAAVQADALAGCLRAEASQAAPWVRHLQGRREVLAWQELGAPAEVPLAFREGGVYLITGGLGGLGRLFAQEILGQTRHARVVLSGRGEPSVRTDALLAKLAADGQAGRIAYHMLDLSSPTDVDACLAAIVRTHGRLDGILHGAGMVADGLLATKSAEQFARVLAPKVAGTIHLDRASAALDLDFFVLFSSGASVNGNPGQGDYALANGFLDQFAAWRSGQVAAGLRRGRSLAINWPLWQEGGMRMPEHALHALHDATGMRPMRTSSGMQAFHRSVAAGLPQVLVIEGDTRRIRGLLAADPAPAVVADMPHTAGLPPAPAPDSLHGPAPADLHGATRDFLRKRFAALFRLPVGKVDPSAPLEKYGIDSILAMELTRELERSFGVLSKTLFFEHQTIDELTAYFVAAHAGALGKLFGAHEAVQSPPAAPAAPEAAAPDRVPSGTGRSRRMRGGRGSLAATPQRAADGAADEPVAIVGLSGRYPASDDIAAFWDNLREGRDCITEIPPERWDWRDYYSTDRTQPGAHYSKWGGFISGVDEFDPLFFNIPPVDAALLDPQERLFLQHAWMAVEDAGLTRSTMQRAHPDMLPGQVGVYVGVMYGEYQLFGAEASVRGERLGVPVSYASIANRVSYVMNLHGPSMTLDSMCSSSLTAIHLACQDLRQGRTSLAIAGGVNVTIHPNKYLILSAGQYISGDGHCQSFGEGGDGYIPGEGVGVVVLKRLSDAERDGNHIYGLIRASALNHGGKTNGYSVPNPKAQADVIAMALRQCGIAPRQVSYVEAHGTGTRLGDPIEIAALSQVFARSAAERQFCAIGSAKSNIGHCESAAGIAGLTKILLQFKYRSIAPSLHSTVLNPNIDFEHSPFFVNQTLRPWDAPVVDGRELPRVAGLSSFGAGGSNAHLVVEEYRAPAPQVRAAGEPVIIPLSARTTPQLAHRVRDLLDFLRREAGRIDLSALAFTLQTGREAMDARLAVVVSSLEQLGEKLAAWAQGGPEVEQLWFGLAEQHADEMALLRHDDDMSAAIARWMERRKLPQLAELWTKGYPLDWTPMLPSPRPRLMSLPTYPFAKDRYWVPRGAPAPRAAAGSALHPLVHANASDFFRQRYVATFSGDEFFLADHRVALGDTTLKVLPGVACLEMARAAAELALPAGGEPRNVVLRNVAWSRPVVVASPTEVSVELQVADDGRLRFEISSGEGEGREALVHCEGEVHVFAAGEREHIDLAAVTARTGAAQRDAEALYRAFAGMGLAYGPSFRSLAGLRQGQDEVLAELVLPDIADAAPDDFLLHPALADGALQACMGLASLDALPERPAVPFALDAITLMAPCAPRMYAWVRRAGDAHTGVERIDIALCDPQGAVCAQLSGLSSRPMSVPPRAPGAGTLLAVPRWQAIEAPLPAAPAGRVQHVLLCGMATPVDALAAQLPQAVLAAAPGTGAAGGSLGARFGRAAEACLDVLQGVLREDQGTGCLVQVVAPHGGADHAFAGLAGLLATARQEAPRLAAQLVLVEGEPDAAMLAAHLSRAATLAGELRVRVSPAGLDVWRWQEQELPADTGAPTGFREQGVYLITGGLGGLGRLFAREILQGAAGTTVILTGRRPLSSDQEAAMARLCADCGAAPERVRYCQLDLDDAASVRGLVSRLVDLHGGIHGVLHSAGMLRDGRLLTKRRDDFAAVLAPKVTGTEHLDHATRGVALDFFVLFSSVAGAIGNAGQGDYAAANGFLDDYARVRNVQVAAGLASGHTRALGWPLWAEGGMQLDAQAVARLSRDSGMHPLGTAAGMQAFHRSLALDADQVLVLGGDVTRLRQALHATPAAAPDAEPAHGLPPSDRSPLQQKAEALVGQTVATLLGVPAHEVSPKAALEKYGMDSVLAMKITAALEETFGALSKTLLFEYQTISALAAYLVRAFPDVLRRHGAGQAQAGAAAQLPAVPEGRAAPAQAGFKRRPAAGEMPLPGPAAERDEAIAIIGVAGRYPQARNLAEFWDNLRSGRDCVTEIPPERWDHAPYFAGARNQPGKTYSKWGGFLENVDHFDALFFNISPREATLMDPQERLFIETVWETMEDAGYTKEALGRERVGVYVGVMWGHYELFGAGAGSGVPSSSFASIANRVSYFFDFHGPSLALDTMCSSSLTAIHLACEALRTRGADLALAGGVNLSLHPNKYLSLAQGNFASTDGRCRSFGAGGDGYVPGEGVGAVLLKPLERALADGDRVLGVVKASAINHGGKTNGYTVPNPVAQADLVLDALRKAAIDPATIGYIETHGTGTSLGDPIEINGLLRAFEAAGGAGSERAPCLIGSVKSNIGHLESAAGIAAVTKVLLQMKHGQIVPSLHAGTLNPHIDFAATPFRVQTQLADWPRPAGHPRRASVSSFGAGGANAHLIIEEYLHAPVPGAPEGRPELFLLSARNDAALAVYARRLADHLSQAGLPPLRDIAFTSRCGRTAMPVRLAIVADSIPALRDRLLGWLGGGQQDEAVRETVFASPGRNARGAGQGADAMAPGAAEAAMRRRDLAGLARAWVAGQDMDWSAMHADERPRRVSLPGYPFARERYWIDAVPLPRPERPGPAGSDAGQVLHYRPEWRAAPLPDDALLQGHILVLGADDRLSAALERQAAGCPVVAVVYEDGYRQFGPNGYCVRPDSAEDYRALVDALAHAGTLPTAVVHLVDEHLPVSGLLERGVHALHGLCQALAHRKPRDRVRILCVQRRRAAEQVALHQALAGYLKTLAQENPAFGWKTLSWDGEGDDPSLARWLLREMAAPVWHDGEIRYSHDAPDAVLRETRGLARVAPSASPRGGDAVRHQGTYIVTGGLGGLGYIFARHLARQYRARLVLTGRSAADDSHAGKVAALHALGGEAIYLQADVADRDQVEALVALARRRFGAIHGIVHSAGVTRDSFILHKSREDMAAVLAPKVAGALHLDHATRQDPLDLFVLFSSVSGVWGNPGQCDYAFANAFLDAFAGQRQQRVQAGQRSGKVLSINWPFWQDGGMRLSEDELALARERSGVAAMPTAVGLAFWETALAADHVQCMALYGDADRIEASLRRTMQPDGHPAGHGPAGDAAPLRAAAEDYLRQLLGAEIGLQTERIDAHERFDAYGVDSMMIGRINATLERDLGPLPKTLFYEYACIAELAAYLVDAAGSTLGRVLGVALESSPEGRAEEADAPGAAPAPAPAVAVMPGRALEADEQIAIIGLHGSFPKSASLDEFWRNLRDGRDLVSPVPASRWDADAFFDPDPEAAQHGRIYCKWGSFVEDFDKFDAGFFNVSPHDAALMDPQERLFLQSVWSTIEDAGYTRDSLKQRHAKGRSADVGVFVGVTTNSYHLLGAEEWTRGNMVTPGSLPWSIANRVSYFFDFQGPSMPVDTACSSSLVAIHLACESLKKRECQVAVAGGVNLYLHPAKYQSLCRRRMLALEGKCRSFGDGDDGFIPGEGVASVLLKPLSQALADGDHIYGVVAASACDHSGRSNGYSAPNPNSQAALIEGALHKAGIDPESISYVEGHGTGTQLGDSLEIVSLSQAFRKHTAKTQFCALGSVKANLGHSESAAGITGVAKILLQFKHREIAPSIHAETLNPNIEFERSPFYLQRERCAWVAPPGVPRRAMINSFGAGGVNACLILDEHAEPPETQPGSGGMHLLILSARNEARLREAVLRLRDRIEAEPALDLARVAHTLQVGREAMEARLAVLAADQAALDIELSAYLNGVPSGERFEGRVEPHRRRKPLTPGQQEEVRALFARAAWRTLAERWVQGDPIDWRDARGPQAPRRLPLPTYPFARERHWISASPSTPPSAPQTELHPLITANVSTLREVAFVSRLSAAAWYGRDHKVNGASLFPGAGFLELACVAGAIAGEGPARRIEDVVWVQPLPLGPAPQPVRTVLRPAGQGTEFQVVSFDEDNDRVVHAEGRLVPEAPCARSRYDLATLRRQAHATLSGADCYRRFAAFGFHYGPCFQTIQELDIGEGFALSRLALQAEALAGFEQYVLHPGLIDGALQTVIGLAADSDTGVAYLPFAINALQVHRALSPNCYAHVVQSSSTQPGTRQFDIRLLDERGEVMVSLDGFYVRALQNPAGGAHGGATGTVLAE